MSAEALEGLSIPTYFVNRVVVAQAMGPCIKFFLAAAVDGSERPCPEVCVIWDAAALAAQREMISDALNAALEHLPIVATHSAFRFAS